MTHKICYTLTPQTNAGVQGYTSQLACRSKCFFFPYLLRCLEFSDFILFPSFLLLLLFLTTMDVYTLVSCAFNLHCPYYWLDWASFHMLISHMGFFFCSVFKILPIFFLLGCLCYSNCLERFLNIFLLLFLSYM